MGARRGGGAKRVNDAGNAAVTHGKVGRGGPDVAVVPADDGVLHHLGGEQLVVHVRLPRHGEGGGRDEGGEEKRRGVGLAWPAGCWRLARGCGGGRRTRGGRGRGAGGWTSGVPGPRLGLRSRPLLLFFSLWAEQNAGIDATQNRA